MVVIRNIAGEDNLGRFKTFWQMKVRLLDTQVVQKCIQNSCKKCLLKNLVVDCIKSVDVASTTKQALVKDQNYRYPNRWDELVPSLA